MNIRKKLIMSVVLLYLLLISIFVADSLWRQREFTIGETRIQALNYATLLSENLLSWVLAEDLMGMEEVLKSSTRMPHTKYACVVSPTGQVIAHSERGKVGTFLTDSESIALLRDEQRESKVWRDDQSFIHVAAPLGGQENYLGWTLVGVDTSLMAAHLRDLLNKGIFYTALAIISGVVAAWLLSGSILKQLAHIMRGIRRLRNNDFSAAIPVCSEDEFGHMASALNQASDFLRRNQEQLRREIQERMGAEAQIRHLTRRLVDGNEEERKRLGHDLHDEFGQSVTGLLFGLHALKKHLKGENREAQELCDQMIAESKRFGEDIRRVAAGQYPVILERLGLKAEASSFLSELERRHGEMEISYNINLPEKRLHPRIEASCYRILQEAVVNILRHSEASRMHVEISSMKDWLYLRVADNGKGFDAEAMLEQSLEYFGIGLLGMHARVLAVDGNIEVESSPGNGCIIDVFLPMLWYDGTQGRKAGQNGG